ncbi:hypothetical protein CAEBREN_17812 [Caenorhabditis brenneri]|uniref:Uncharacterized protein n=1 Tax=Caenorhabditis brenneri TaxID=135651 RepID=G0PB56_CAEBE|nr:hypothetical protein CAEBREN_17812 [Caenorhabditis brenneri]
MQGAPPPPPPLQTRFEIVNTVYNDPFFWSVFKGVIGFGVGVVVARSVSEEWATVV